VLNQLSGEDIKALWAMTLLAILWIINCFTMKADSTLTATVFTIIAGLAGYQVRSTIEMRRIRKKKTEAAKS